MVIILFLVIQTEKAEGQTVSIDLDDDVLDYEYQGRKLKGDMFRNVCINGEETKIMLKAIKQTQ